MSESFNSAAPAPTPAPAAPVAPPAVDQPADQPVLEYGGKALTQAEVLKKLQSADEFINTLKSEREEDRRLLAEATKRLEAAATAQDLLKQTPAPAAPAPKQEPIDIAAAVEQVVTARERKQLEDANWKAAQDAMTKAFGEKADAKAKEVADSVGMSFEDVVKLARTTPKAFQRLFPELQAAPATPSPSFQGGTNTQAIKAADGAKPRSGFWETGSAKERTAIYRKRLQELGVE